VVLKIVGLLFARALKPSCARHIAELICALLFFAAAPLPAQQPLPVNEADAWGAAIFAGSGETGMVMVVVRGNQVLIRGYGETAPGSGIKPDASSLLRLCSISKIFTGDLLVRLAAERKVGLNDPLERSAPHGKVVPQGPGDAPITLLDLATHTAGLTREVSSYPRNTPHFTFPNYTYRWNWLPTQKITSTPGSDAVYSNIGFDLLGDALATGAHKSYVKLLDEDILQPLGLHDTTVWPNQQQCARLLRGSGDEGPCTGTEQSAASGGVYSTGTDMARMMESLMHVDGVPPQPVEAMAVYIQPSQLKRMDGLSHAGDPTGIGLGWVQLGDSNAGGAVMQKTGGGAGFWTYIALIPKQQVGIFFALTDGTGNSTIHFYDEANHLLTDLAGLPQLPPRKHIARAARERAGKSRAGKSRATAKRRPSRHR
jgi:D-alanyl-D-alanine-carboxypeptidase/D-alanyl-D-alanine-endopeptidase